MKRRGVWIALGSLLVADCVVLTSVYRTRRSPASSVTVTERELTLGFRRVDDSRIAVHPQWYDPAKTVRLGSEWLDEKKLTGLGINPERGVHRKDVLAVVEATSQEPGPRWRIVDAGLDSRELRAMYPDRARFSLMAATVRGDATSGPPRSLEGAVEPPRRLLYVPGDYRSVFAQLGPSVYPVTEPRYEITLCFDDSGQMWICGARGRPR